MSDSPPFAEQNQAPSDSEAENLALAAADAIKRLVRERQVLRDQLAAQAREIKRLRDHIALLRDNYRKLANELIAQLKLVDNLETEPQSPAAAQLHWLHAEHQKWS